MSSEAMWTLVEKPTKKPFTPKPEPAKLNRFSLVQRLFAVL